MTIAKADTEKGGDLLGKTVPGLFIILTLFVVGTNDLGLVIKEP